MMGEFPQQAMGACEEGQGCYLSRDATKCMSAGMKSAGEACDSPNECSPGLHCLVVCTEVCSLDGAHAPACGDCPSGEINDTISPDNNIGLCLTETIPAQCNIFSQDDCGAGEGCYSVRGGHACISAGNKPEGAECSSGNECVPGAMCINGACLPYCRNSEDTPMEHRCDTKCPNEFLTLRPQIWQQGACTNVQPANPCDFWLQDCEGGRRCLPTVLGESCVPAQGMSMLDQPCQDHENCGPGLVCPRDAGVCKQACSIEPFVDGAMPIICADDCPSGAPGMPIEPDSRIGFCP